MNAPTERYRIAADNRKARYNYEIIDTIEAGLVLTGEELFLFNAYIPEYLEANRFNHLPKRDRKLLLHKKQVNKLMGAIQREGMTLIPLKVYFNDKGRAKVELGLGKGKKLHDKREAEKKRDWDREKGRILRDKG